MRGLYGEALAGAVLVLPVFAHLVYHAAELVSHYRGVFFDVVRYALMAAALDGGLIGAHAD